MEARTADTEAPAAVRLLRIKEVINLTGLSRTTILTFAKEGKFPDRIVLSGRLVAWDSRAVERWIAERLEAGAKSAAAARPN